MLLQPQQALRSSGRTMPSCAVMCNPTRIHHSADATSAIIILPVGRRAKQHYTITIGGHVGEPDTLACSATRGHPPRAGLRTRQQACTISRTKMLGCKCRVRHSHSRRQCTRRAPDWDPLHPAGSCWGGGRCVVATHTAAATAQVSASTGVQFTVSLVSTKYVHADA
jgi:hypothetical protein